MKRFAIRTSFILVCLLSFSTNVFSYEREIEILASDMSEKIAKSGKAKIAVVDFTDLRGDVTELGRFISEELSVSLAGAGKGFKIVDRTHLKSILQEHKLSSTGLIDPATARKLGEIAGVEALITGSLTPFGDTVRITVKVLDTETAEIIEAKKENIAKTEIIEELLAVRFEPGAGLLQNNSNGSKSGSSKQSETKNESPTKVNTSEDEEPPTVIDWNDTAKKQRGRLDQNFSYICPPNGRARTIYGTKFYTDDSSICTAAVHAGLITVKDGGKVTIKILPGRDSYSGTESNWVKSRRYGSWGGSFTFVTN